jgi:hypothetical protein
MSRKRPCRRTTYKGNELPPPYSRPSSTKTRPDYQMISHMALWRLLHRDSEFRSGSRLTGPTVPDACPEYPRIPDEVVAMPRSSLPCHFLPKGAPSNNVFAWRCRPGSLRTNWVCRKKLKKRPFMLGARGRRCSVKCWKDLTTPYANFSLINTRVVRPKHCHQWRGETGSSSTLLFSTARHRTSAPHVAHQT